jgi:hypothetical protein
MRIKGHGFFFFSFIALDAANKDIQLETIENFKILKLLVGVARDAAVNTGIKSEHIATGCYSTTL